MKQLLLWVTVILWLSPAIASADNIDQSQHNNIVVTPGTLHDYYHLKLRLQAGDYELSIPNRLRSPKYSEDNSYRFEDGGQFEIFIRKEIFPASLDTSVASEFIILRMPWTRSDMSESERSVQQKRKLFDRLKQLKQEPEASEDIVVEFNPYIAVLSGDPLKLKLTAPNIFFRQAWGQYINYIGPLKQEDHRR
ncbi:hypothetical protein [Spongorhabdus nitratireducens]